MDNCVDLDPLEYSSYNQDSDMFSRRNNNSPTKFVESLINNHKVVVFSKSHCPHCNHSKSLLKDLGVEYATVELDKMEEGSQVQNTLAQMTDARTVPRIFIKGQCVGGNSDLQSMGSSGQLQSLLTDNEDTRDSLDEDKKDSDYYS